MYISGYIVRLKCRYTKIPLSVKAVFWFTVCSFLQRGISFITIPIFTRLLSAEDYGFTSIYYSWSSIFSIIVTLNLGGGGFNNAMLKYEERRDAYCSSIACLCICITAFCFVLYISFNQILNNFVKLPIQLMIVMFVEIMFAQIFTVWAARQRFEFKYHALVVATLFVSLIASTTGIFFVRFAQQKAFVRIISNAIVCIAVYLFIFLFLILKGKNFFKKEFWKFALGFNVPLIPHYLSQIVLNQADRIMISNYCGNRYAGIYSVSYNFSLVLMILIQSVSASFTPWIYEKFKIRGYRDIRKVSSVMVYVFAVITMIPIIIGPEIIHLFVPTDYFEAVYVIPPVGLSMFFIFLYGLFGTVSFYHGKTVFIAVGSVIAALCNIVLNAYFIPRFGYLAAGYTTLVCYIVYSIVHYSFMRHIARTEKIAVGIFNVRLILTTSIVMIALSIGMLFLYRVIVLRYVILLISVIIIVVKRGDIWFLLRSLKKQENDITNYTNGTTAN
jgi:O-antigen/teichoic acid export membrane protein